MTAVEFPLTREEFAQRLAAYPNQDRVEFFALKACWCPLARVLSEELALRVRVDMGEASYPLMGRWSARARMYLPNWAVAFILAIDRLGVSAGITPRLALGILRRLDEEVDSETAAVPANEA